MFVQANEFGAHEPDIASGFLRPQSQHPVPEVSVDPVERSGCRLPGGFVLMRKVREDEIDFDGPWEYHHPAHRVGQTIPLLRERFECGDQARECLGGPSEVRCLNNEVVVRTLRGTPLGP